MHPVVEDKQSCFMFFVPAAVSKFPGSRRAHEQLIATLRGGTASHDEPSDAAEHGACSDGARGFSPRGVPAGSMHEDIGPVSRRAHEQLIATLRGGAASHDEPSDAAEHVQ